MTEPDVVVLSKAVADVVRDVVRQALDAYEKRLQTVQEATAEAMTQTRAACLRELGDLRERVAVIEVREPVPGPPGPPGPPGIDGKDGLAGLRFQGVYVHGKTYEPGDLTTWDGSSWHCNETTTSKPGDGSKGWTLMVKRGRDGKDAK